MQASTRRSLAYRLREEAAEVARRRPHPDHLSNGEELEYRRPNGTLGYTANYSKALPHNSRGEVVPQAYRLLLAALDSGDPNDFARIPMGRPAGLNLTNPQAGLAFDLEGPDAQAVTIKPAPRIDQPENSAEMAELYWMAVLRDVAFSDYAGNPLAGQAADSLTDEFTRFTGPRQEVSPGNFRVTPATLFRGFTAGDLVGPYVSQFLLKGSVDPLSDPVPPDDGFIRYGTLRISQRQRTAAAGQDYLTNFADWLAVQDGEDRRNTDVFDNTRRFIRNLRDLATYVHFDALYEAYLNACLLLLSMPARLDPGNPYVGTRGRRTQDGFGTFGAPHVLSLVTEVATRALKAVWFQKWGVHRRLRPEEFGGRIQVHLVEDPGRYPMIDHEILESLQPAGGLGAHFSAAGGFLLPQAFPEGAPTHPAYGAGHATVSGACVTVLKAWFDESEVFDPNVVALPSDPALEARLRENRQPKVPNAQGTGLVDHAPPANEPPLTVGGELNKLAANIALGRNAAGVHWRSDYTESVRLGEDIAIRILQEQRLTYNEDHHLALTKFDGTAITI
jgi:hypothetical protein